VAWRKTRRGKPETRPDGPGGGRRARLTIVAALNCENARGKVYGCAGK
jgi:hypothetical protein